MARRVLYLAGPIAGLSYQDAKGGWREDLCHALRSEMYGEALVDHFELLSPMRWKEWLQGTMSLAHDPGPAQTKQIIARDLSDIRRCDLFVLGLNAGATKVSIGSMIELGYAKALGKPVLVIAQEYDLGVHTHGWIKEMADIWACNLEMAAEQILAFCSEGL